MTLLRYANKSNIMIYYMIYIMAINEHDVDFKLRENISLQSKCISQQIGLICLLTNGPLVYMFADINAHYIQGVYAGLSNDSTFEWKLYGLHWSIVNAGLPDVRGCRVISHHLDQWWPTTLTYVWRAIPAPNMMLVKYFSNIILWQIEKMK